MYLKSGSTLNKTKKMSCLHLFTPLTHFFRKITLTFPLFFCMLCVSCAFVSAGEGNRFAKHPRAWLVVVPQIIKRNKHINKKWNCPGTLIRLLLLFVRRGGVYHINGNPFLRLLKKLFFYVSLQGFSQEGTNDKASCDPFSFVIYCSQQAPHTFPHASFQKAFVLS